MLSPFEIATLRASIRFPYQPEWVSRNAHYGDIPCLIFRAGPDYAILYHGSVVALTPNLLIATSCMLGEFESPGYLHRILDPTIDPETVADPTLLAQRRRMVFENNQAIAAENERKAKAIKRRDQLFDLETMSLDALDRLSPLDP